MNEIFLYCVLFILIILAFRTWKTERDIKKLLESVQARRRSLVKTTGNFWQSKSLEDLFKFTNQLIDKYNAGYSKTSELSNQIESTLQVVQDAIFVLNAENVIEYANKAAEQIFNAGRVIESHRLESVVHSSSLLEFLADYKDADNTIMQTIKVEYSGEIKWFEVSISRIPRNKSSLGDAFLLFLHEITRLKQAELMQRDFIANISHELRTPVTIIKGFSETLTEDYDILSEQEKKRFLTKIYKNTRRLHVLVEDLLKLSTLEIQQDLMEYKMQSIEKLFREVVENYSKRIDKKRQSIYVDCEPSIKPFIFDNLRINQVLDNLLENAFRYAPDFTSLRISACLNDDKSFVECTVSDNGPGIPKKSLPNLFDRFYVVDKGRSIEKGGTGLGLSIIKQIVLRHGGQVKAESSLGKGTSIIFTLPYRQFLTN